MTDTNHDGFVFDMKTGNLINKEYLMQEHGLTEEQAEEMQMFFKGFLESYLKLLGFYQPAGTETTGPQHITTEEMLERLKALGEDIRESNSLYDEITKLQPFIDEELKKDNSTFKELAKKYTLGELLDLQRDPESDFSKLMEAARKAQLINNSDFLPVENYNLPFGPYLFVLMEAIEHIGTGRQIYPNLTTGGAKKNNRNTRVNYEPYSDNGFTLTHRNKNARTSITILNKELIKSTSAIKLFVFLLAKSAQQNFKPVIYFSLEELVNIGMYSNINNARAGFKNHILAIQSIQIAGEVKKYADKKNKGNIKQQGGVLFYNYQLDQNGVSVWVNPAFNIEYLAGYYAIVPNWAFSLSDRGFNLLVYILLLARTNRKNHFNIGFEQIRERLALPTKKEYDDINRHIKEDNKNRPPEEQKPLKKFKPQQYIKTPIKTTIGEIENNITINQCDYLEIRPHYEETAGNIDQWLKDSFLEVKVKGDLAAQITGHINKQKQIIEHNAERKAAIIDAKKQE